jgi:starvation-inducible DNA-binding protein
MPTFSVALKPDVRREVAADLQSVLVALLDLSLQGKQAHWNIVGPFFPALHAQLDQVVEDVRAWSDTVAERIVALGVAAQGQAHAIAEGSGLEELPTEMIADKAVVRLVAERLAVVATRVHECTDGLDERDPVSQDILLEVEHGLEKHLWMFRAQLG